METISNYKPLKNKIKDRAAFTLGEVLVAILIMLMVSGIVAAGIPAAKNAYENVVAASNAEVLLSTTISALRNEVGTAGFVHVESSGEDKDRAVTFVDSTTHTASRISLAKSGSGDGILPGMIMLQENAAASLDGLNIQLSKEEGEPATLVPQKAIEDGQYVTYTKVSYADSVVTFEGLKVKNKAGTVLAPKGNGFDLAIRVISGTDD